MKNISIVLFSLCVNLFNIDNYENIWIPPIKEYYFIMKYIYQNKIVYNINCDNDLLIYYDLNYIRNFSILKKYILEYNVPYIIINDVLINYNKLLLKNYYRIKYSYDYQIIDLYYIYTLLQQYDINYKIAYFKNEINPISEIILAKNSDNLNEYFDTYTGFVNENTNPKIYLYNNLNYEEQEEIYVKEINLKENVEIQIPKKIKDYLLLPSESKIEIYFKDNRFNIKSKDYNNHLFKHKLVIYSEDYYIQQKKIENIKTIKYDTKNIIQTDNYFIIICKEIKNFYKVKQYLVSIMRYAPKDFEIIDFKNIKHIPVFKQINSDKCLTEDTAVLVIKNKEIMNKYINKEKVSIYRNIIAFDI